MNENIDNDFGFTFSSDEGPKARVISNEGPYEIKFNDLQTRINQAWDILNPFLTNLQKEPDQPMLKWVDRAVKVKEFQNRLKVILFPSVTTSIDKTSNT